MKTESKLFRFLFIFFLIVAGIYLASSMAVMGHVEPIGETVFVLSALMNGMITFYMSQESKHIPPRPEDSKTADIATGAGTLGFFPPKSIWPFWCALTLAIFMLGPVFGWWLSVLGAILGLWAVCGWCYEYYVGDYRH